VSAVTTKPKPALRKAPITPKIDLGKQKISKEVYAKYIKAYLDAYGAMTSARESLGRRPMKLGDSSVLKTDSGKVIGFGRVKVPKMPKIGFDYEIPLLSYVVIERDDGDGYIASCIHLQIDGYGHDSLTACHDMISSILFYLRENFKCANCIDATWDNMYEQVLSNPQSGALWDKYHALQYRLAKSGVSTDIHHEKIESLQNEFDKLGARLIAEQDKSHKLEAKLSAAESEFSDLKSRYDELWDSYLCEISKSELMGSMIVEERVV